MEYDYVKRDVSNRREEVSGFKRRQQTEILHPFCPGKVLKMERRLFIILKNIYSQMPYTLLDEPKYPFRQRIRFFWQKRSINWHDYCNASLSSPHIPLFMLGTLHAKIYNLDTKDYEVSKWSDLDNVRYFYDFFKKHENEFT